MHEPQGEVGSEISLQHERSFVFDHSGMNHRGLHHRQQSLGIDSKLGGQRERLGKPFIDQSNLQIHRQLGSLSLAGVAHAEEQFSHSRKQGLQLLDGSLFSTNHKN